jgi:hypothetical protein
VVALNALGGQPVAGGAANPLAIFGTLLARRQQIDAEAGLAPDAVSKGTDDIRPRSIVGYGADPLDLAHPLAREPIQKSKLKSDVSDPTLPVSSDIADTTDSPASSATAGQLLEDDSTGLLGSRQIDQIASVISRLSAFTTDPVENVINSRQVDQLGAIIAGLNSPAPDTVVDALKRVLHSGLPKRQLDSLTNLSQWPAFMTGLIAALTDPVGGALGAPPVAGGSSNPSAWLSGLLGRGAKF